MRANSVSSSLISNLDYEADGITDRSHNFIQFHNFEDLTLRAHQMHCDCTYRTHHRTNGCIARCTFTLMYARPLPTRSRDEQASFNEKSTGSPHPQQVESKLLQQSVTRQPVSHAVARWLCCVASFFREVAAVQGRVHSRWVVFFRHSVCVARQFHLSGGAGGSLALAARRFGHRGGESVGLIQMLR